jgi:transposase InsO family protein
MEEIIEKIYKENYYPNTDELYKILKKDNISVTKKQVKAFLDKKDEEQIQKIQNKDPKKSGHIVASYENQLWQIDIFILAKYEKWNKSYQDMLCAIDVFTRKIYCVKMKNKESETVLESFEKMIKIGGVPQQLVSDTDSAFTSNKFKQFIEHKKINHVFVPIGDHNSLGIIDRFARTIKQRLTKIFLMNKENNWIDHIDGLISKYNNSPHSAIGEIKPNDADKPDNIAIIAEINRIKRSKNNTISDLQIGDKVRVNIKGQFDKGTEPQFSNEVYTVEKVNGQTVYINNGEKKKRHKLLKVDKDAKNIEKSVVKIAKQKRKAQIIQKREDIQQENIVREVRVKKAPNKLNL